MGDYESSSVPNEALESAVELGSKAIRILLVARMTRPWIAALAGKLIDTEGDKLEEEKREAELKAAAEAARKKTAVGRLRVKEEKRKQRKKKGCKRQETN